MLHPHTQCRQRRIAPAIDREEVLKGSESVDRLHMELTRKKQLIDFAMGEGKKAVEAVVFW